MRDVRPGIRAFADTGGVLREQRAKPAEAMRALSPAVTTAKAHSSGFSVQSQSHHLLSVRCELHVDVRPAEVLCRERLSSATTLQRLPAERPSEFRSCHCPCLIVFFTRCRPKYGTSSCQTEDTHHASYCSSRLSADWPFCTETRVESPTAALDVDSSGFRLRRGCAADSSASPAIIGAVKSSVASSDAIRDRSRTRCS